MGWDSYLSSTAYRGTWRVMLQLVSESSIVDVVILSMLAMDTARIGTFHDQGSK